VIFYGVSVLEIFASFAIDEKYVHTFLVNTLIEECFEFLWKVNERRNLLLRSMFDLQKGVDYARQMNLYNLIFQMVILIPFLTQPPHERTLTGRGSRVYPTSGQPGIP
jgi:hypothetical protein